MTHDTMARITAMLAERKSPLSHFIDSLEGSHRDIKKLKATILKHVKDEELFPEAVRVLPPAHRRTGAVVVGIAQSEEMADHGKMNLQYIPSKLSQREHLAGLSRELLQDILRYLHCVRLVVWHEEIKHLESTIFLLPTFLMTMFKLLVWHHLIQQLQSISMETLVGEHATIRDRANWVWTFRSKATLCHQAVRALVKHQLRSEGMWHGFEEIMGHRPHGGRGKLFSLLEHSGLCLEAEVSEVWGDHPKDLHIYACFSPKIPEGFFQRHWMPKVTGLLVCNSKPLQIKENNQRAYSYLELCCRKPSERTGKIHIL
ncbi:hypothetical protein DUI87_22844 [Hirundo rustica rustica]|uniref:Uncharacterized protein n=1 Tax=Hirundo rustica rustica TaxID=333673 RepID=A0A3M0JHA7_HIRRU|nr:hypothetical protein DUI87_22844 [Hirundo rustica rustica]